MENIHNLSTTARDQCEEMPLDLSRPMLENQAMHNINTEPVQQFPLDLTIMGAANTSNRRIPLTSSRFSTYNEETVQQFPMDLTFEGVLANAGNSTMSLSPRRPTPLANLETVCPTDLISRRRNIPTAVGRTNIQRRDFLDNTHPQTVQTSSSSTTSDGSIAYQVLSEEYLESRKFQMGQHITRFRIKTIPDTVENPVAWIKKAVEGIVSYIMKNIRGTDKIGFTFTSSEMFTGYLKFREARELTIEDVWSVLGSIFQSNSEGLITDTFRIILTHVAVPSGCGRKNTYINFAEESRERLGIIHVNNKDNLCLIRAVVVGKAYSKGSLMKKDIRKNKGRIQDLKTEKLLLKTAITIPQEGAGIVEINKLQNYYSAKYKITVYEYGSRGRNVIFEGKSQAMHKINLLHHNNHFNVITSLTAAFAAPYYCENCHTPYYEKNKHKCSAACPACNQHPICEKGETVQCTDCNRNYRNRNCFEKHKTSNYCVTVRRCKQCLRSYSDKRPHNCTEFYCKICKSYQSENHSCYIQPDKSRANTKNVLYVFFDFECRQETQATFKAAETEASIHEPNLCVFFQCCSECITSLDPQVNKVCSKCGVKLQILNKDDCVSNFVEYLLNMRKIFKKVVVLAHNAGSYDHQFILRHLLEKSFHKPELIMRGTKIILMEIGNLKFIDSINYFPMRLADLPQAFGLPRDNFKKSHFPHFFNVKANENYVGIIPDLEFYGLDSMRASSDPEEKDERKVFLEWHRTQRANNVIFDFKKELVEYCISDVSILTAACMKFRNAMLSECLVDPFLECVTIASTCNKVFRRSFLKEETIGILPQRGYRKTNNQSKIALKWMIEESEKRQVQIKHAGNSREVRVNGIDVDGFYQSPSNPQCSIILQFYGCFWHGCPLCFPLSRDKPIHKNSTETLEDRYNRTMTILERLKVLGHEVITCWECNYKPLISDNHPMLLQAPLQPRDALMGGRTGNCYMYYKAVEGKEKIKYLDVCSLYPFVCKYGTFPIGYPELFIGNEECTKLNLFETCGLIKCSILPPSDLIHPVLGIKSNGKLLFVLCRSCGETLNQGLCMHSDDERTLYGTWVIAEVIKAIQLNYVITRIEEVWRYKSVQYSKESGEPGLFGNFINKFLKLKQEASGWPEDCNTPEAQEQYIKEYYEKEGIQLDREQIVKNPGARSVAKLTLNSFWGKFAQRSNQPQTKIINEPEELFNLLSNSTIEVNHIQIVNENTLIVNWSAIEEDAEQLSTVNVVIAAFVTSIARLRLYEELEKLGDRVLYYDTDSVFYISRPGQYEVPTGSFLGDMTDELEGYGKDSYITEFCSGGPKNYAYQFFSTDKQKILGVCKVKGFSLNYKASQLINFQAMRDMIIRGDENEFIPIVTRNIQRTRDHEVISINQSKNYKIVSLKRKFCNKFKSLPYGHIKLRANND